MPLPSPKCDFPVQQTDSQRLNYGLKNKVEFKFFILKFPGRVRGRGREKRFQDHEAMSLGLTGVDGTGGAGV